MIILPVWLFILCVIISFTFSNNNFNIYWIYNLFEDENIENEKGDIK